MIINKAEILKIRNEIESIGFLYFGTTVKSFIKDFIEDTVFRYIVFCDMKAEKVAGYLIILNVLDEAEIIQVAVKPEFLRHGVGSELMNECFKYLQTKNSNSLFLEVRESNSGAISFYKKLGFIETGRRKKYYSDPAEDALIMQKKLCIHHSV